MKDQRPPAEREKRARNARVQGEGDYESARAYKRDIDEFIARKEKEIPGMAKDAERALEGPEREKLQRAEEKGSSKARK
jgi:hypothetical protein